MFKSFDEFVRVDEGQGREKLVVIDEKPRTPNGEVAYKVRFIGKSFDHEVMEMYFQTDAKMKAVLDKLRANPDQYFIAYYTKKDGTNRFLSENKTWVAFIELINNTKTGQPAYQNFNAVPYNGYVPYEELEKIAAPSNGDIVNASKAAVGQVSQQIQAEPTPPPVPAPAPNTNAVDPNQTAQPQPTQPVQPTQGAGQTAADVVSFVQTLNGLKLGSRGPLVAKLQRIIELIANAKQDKMTLNINKQNISSKTLKYDGIWSKWTSQALGHVLGGEISVSSIGPNEISKLTNLLGGITLNAINSISPLEEEAFTNKKQPEQTYSLKQNKTAAPNAATASQPSQPTQPAANITAAKTTPGSQSVDTTLGKIYFA